MKRILVDCETTGTDPSTDRIVCISVMDIETRKIITFIDLDEQLILARFWEYLPNEPFELIGFCSESFDLPFLIQRSILKYVKVKRNFKSIDLRKYATGFFFSYNRFAKGTLNDFGQALGMEPKKEDGCAILKLFIDHNYDAIKEHCEYDIRMTFELYRRLIYCNVLE